jgi:hypothetical protein
MLTVGGVVYEKRCTPEFEAGEFNRLHFVRPGKEPYRIDVPKLTMKEMSHLEKSALMEPDECEELEWLKAKERSSYLRLYRYLPTFVAAEV